jgi:hypothetical protein
MGQPGDGKLCWMYTNTSAVFLQVGGSGYYVGALGHPSHGHGLQSGAHMIHDLLVPELNLRPVADVCYLLLVGTRWAGNIHRRSWFRSEHPATCGPT